MADRAHRPGSRPASAHAWMARPWSAPAPPTRPSFLRRLRGAGELAGHPARAARAGHALRRADRATVAGARRGRGRRAGRADARRPAGRRRRPRGRCAHAARVTLTAAARSRLREGPLPPVALLARAPRARTPWSCCPAGGSAAPASTATRAGLSSRRGPRSSCRCRWRPGSALRAPPTRNGGLIARRPASSPRCRSLNRSDGPHYVARQRHLPVYGLTRASLNAHPSRTGARPGDLAELRRTGRLGAALYLRRRTRRSHPRAERTTSPASTPGEKVYLAIGDYTAQRWLLPADAERRRCEALTLTKCCRRLPERARQHFHCSWQRLGATTLQ